jgi:hypothetical protein
MTDRIENMRREVADEVARDPLFRNEGGLGRSEYSRNATDGSRFILEMFGKLAGNLGGGSVVGGQASDYTDQLTGTAGIGDKAAQAAINGLGLLATSMAYPVSAPVSAAPPAPPAPASGGISIEGGGDSPETQAALRDKIKPEDEARFASAIGGKGYGDPEITKIREAITTKAGDSRSATDRLIQSLPPRGDTANTANWQKKFAEWYVGNVQGKTTAEVERVIDEHIAKKGGELKLKRDTRVGGNPLRGAVVEADCPELGLNAGDKVGFDANGKMYKVGPRNAKDAEIPGITGITLPANGATFTVNHDKGTTPNSAVADKKDAEAMIAYLTGFSPTTAAASVDPAAAPTAPAPVPTASPAPPGPPASTSPPGPPASTSPAPAPAPPALFTSVDEAVAGFNTNQPISTLTASKGNGNTVTLTTGGNEYFWRGLARDSTGVKTLFLQKMKTFLDRIPPGTIVRYGSTNITGLRGDALMTAIIREAAAASPVPAPTVPPAAGLTSPGGSSI